MFIMATIIHYGKSGLPSKVSSIDLRIIIDDFAFSGKMLKSLLAPLHFTVYVKLNGLLNGLVNFKIAMYAGDTVLWTKDFIFALILPCSSELCWVQFRMMTFQGHNNGKMMPFYPALQMPSMVSSPNFIFPAPLLAELPYLCMLSILRLILTASNAGQLKIA